MKASKTSDWLVKCKDMASRYRKVVAHCVGFVLLATILQNLSRFLPPMDGYIWWIYTSTIVLLSLYCWTAVIYSAHVVLANKTVSFWQRAKHAFRKWPFVVLCAMLYVAIFVVMLLWLKLLTYLGTMIAFIGTAMGVWTLLLVGAPLLVINLLLLMTFPLVINTEQSFSQSLRQSIKVALQSRLKNVFWIYLGIMAVLYALSPATIHGEWLISHHLKASFDFLIYLLALLLVVRSVLVIL